MPETMTARFVRVDNGRAVVRLGDTAKETTLRMVGSYFPERDDIVRITRSGSETVVDGLAAPRQPIGAVVTADAGGAAAVVRSDDGRELELATLDGVPALSPGDTVLVFAGYIIGRVRAPLT